MEVKELRVGNIVKINDEYLGPIEGKVISVNERGVVELLLSTSKGNGRRFVCGAEDIFPIPVTEELLLKSGLLKSPYSGKIFMIKGERCECIYYVEGKVLDVRSDNNRASITCKYLHQLQNAYYLATGKELEIKPMPPYRIAHSTFNGETLWAVEKWQPEVQDYGIVQIFTTQTKAEEYLSTLQQGGNINL